MRRTDYDSVCHDYDRRYDETDYGGIETGLLAFVGSIAAPRVLEVGAGTGHWLRFLQQRGYRVVGLDLSAGMLARARDSDPELVLVRAHAERIPFGRMRFERVFCVNALHHFSDPVSFLTEAHGVLRPGGGLMTVGLDPSVERDRWWVYEYFPQTRDLDRERYPAASRIRALMAEAGFVRCDTCEIQLIRAELPAHLARSRGFLERTSTSQLAILSEQEYRAGLDCITRHMAAASAAGTELVLEADLHLYATSGWVG